MDSYYRTIAKPYSGKADTAAKLAFFDRLVCDPELTHLDVRLGWSLLTMRHFKTGMTWASHRFRAQMVNCHPDSARRSLKRLVRRGWFSMSRETGPFGMNEIWPNLDYTPPDFRELTSETDMQRGLHWAGVSEPPDF